MPGRDILAAMALLIESPAAPDTPMSLHDVSKISQTLAEHMQTLPLRAEGFSVEDYFSLNGNYLLEYVDGCLQILPMPDLYHQMLSQLLLLKLLDVLKSDPAGQVCYSPFKVMLDATRYREPDLGVMLGKHAARRRRTHWEGADFVIEIVSESNRRHDLETKRHDYAVAGIGEYWVVDPELKSIRQFVLDGPAYREQAVARGAESVHGHVLAGLTVAAGPLFAEAEARL
jgi:Uma2 family endonuclease